MSPKAAVAATRRHSIAQGAALGYESRSTIVALKGRARVATEIIKNKVPWIIMTIMLAVPRSTFACAACSGRSDDTAAQGLNAAVITLLLVLLMVLGAFVGFLAYLVCLAAKHPLALPGVSERAVR